VKIVEIAALIVGPATHEVWTAAVLTCPAYGLLRPARIPSVAHTCKPNVTEAPPLLRKAVTL
jgi:hypothetical protein